MLRCLHSCPNTFLSWQLLLEYWKFKIRLQNPSNRWQQSPSNMARIYKWLLKSYHISCNPNHSVISCLFDFMPDDLPHIHLIKSGQHGTCVLGLLQPLGDSQPHAVHLHLMGYRELHTCNMSCDETWWTIRRWGELVRGDWWTERVFLREKGVGSYPALCPSSFDCCWRGDWSCSWLDGRNYEWDRHHE